MTTRAVSTGGTEIAALIEMRVITVAVKIATDWVAKLVIYRSPLNSISIFNKDDSSYCQSIILKNDNVMIVLR